MFSVDLPCPRMGELLLRYLTSAAQPSYAPYTPLHILTHVTPNLTVLSPIVLTLPTLLLSLVLLGLSLSLSLLFFSLLSLKVPYRGTSVVDRGPLLASVLLQSPHPLTCSPLSEEKCGFGPLTPLRVATCISTKILLAEVTKK